MLPPIVIDALSRLQAAGGGELHFEAGEYHFYKEGARKEFYAVSNNSACDKYIVFPVIGMRDLVIDGHGATLVFHDVTFPFMISESKNITLRNLFCDTGVSPLVEFVVHDITDKGFCMDLKDPYFVEDGSLMRSYRFTYCQSCYSLSALLKSLPRGLRGRKPCQE